MRNIVGSLLVFVSVFTVSTQAFALTYNSGLYNLGYYNASAVDSTAPVISAISSGTPNQTTATITWTTNESSDSQVQYGSTTSYGSITTLNTTMVTSHSVPLSGLTASTTYHYRVISKDASANSTTSSDQIFITTATPDTTTPVLSGGAPSGSVATGTTTTSISVSTDEASTCRYSTSPSTAYGSMTNTFSTTGGTTHSTTVSGLTNGTSYTYYVRCSDASSNVTTTDYPITFTVSSVSDTTPPTLSSGAPTGTLAAGTTSADITVTTSEASTCRYSQSPNIAYSAMTNTFNVTGGTNHTTSITGLQNGTAYITYIRCTDTANNATTTDYILNFSVASHSTSGGTRIVNPGMPTGCTTTTLYSPYNGARCQNVPLTTPTLTTILPTMPVSNPVTSLFTETLSLGKTHTQVRLLQQYLNTHGYIVAKTGVGSLGKETNYFGSATKAALVKFQKAHTILPATGTMGPMTQMILNARTY